MSCLSRDRGEDIEIVDPKQLNQNNISRLNVSFIYLFDHEKKSWYIWAHSKGKWTELVDEIYDDRDLHEYTDKELADLWEEFSDVATILTKENRNVLDQNWFGWKNGTEVLDVWHWFDERFSTGLGKYMGKNNVI